ncbi:MAG TPA: hypothetical protein VGM76_12790 [Lacipirellulaceae bacterium]|jgi:hypothetical protein
MSDETDGDLPHIHHSSLRFSLRDMLIIVAIVAILMTILAALVPQVWGLIMDSRTDIKMMEAMSARPWLYFFQLNGASMLAWLVGAVLLAKNWRLHPSVSFCGLVGLGGFISIWMGDMMIRMSLSPSRFAFSSKPLWYEVFYIIIRPFIVTACWCFILWAILGWRGNDQRSEPRSH